MSQQDLDSITDKEEKTKANNLWEELKLQEEKLRVAIESNTSYITISTLEFRYRNLAKELNHIFAKYGISVKVKEDHKAEIHRVKKNFDYREKLQATDVTNDQNKNTETFENTEKFPLGDTPVISKQKREGLTLNLDRLQLNSSADESFVASTPILSKHESIRKSKFPTPKVCLDYVKQELPNEIPLSYVETYLEDEANHTELLETIRKGFRLPDIYQIVRDNILRFIAPKEEELANLTVDDTPLYSALDIFDTPNEENTAITMPNALDMRGLSVKDALDLIPRYNGANIPLTQFLDGCAEAQSILPDGIEADFLKFVRIRLYGEALNMTQSQSFTSLKQLSEFFEKMFGSAKTYYDFTGELAKVRQGENEPVVIYLNKLKEIEKEIRRAAQREGRIEDEAKFTAELDKDCLRYFMRGLKWEIKACMETPESYQKAQERAIEKERELSYSLFERCK